LKKKNVSVFVIITVMMTLCELVCHRIGIQAMLLCIVHALIYDTYTTFTLN